MDSLGGQSVPSATALNNLMVLVCEKPVWKYFKFSFTDHYEDLREHYYRESSLQTPEALTYRAGHFNSHMLLKAEVVTPFSHFKREVFHPVYVDISDTDALNSWFSRRSYELGLELSTWLLDKICVKGNWNSNALTNYSMELTVHLQRLDRGELCPVKWLVDRRATRKGEDPIYTATKRIVEEYLQGAIK